MSTGHNIKGTHKVIYIDDTLVYVAIHVHAVFNVRNTQGSEIYSRGSSRIWCGRCKVALA